MRFNLRVLDPDSTVLREQTVEAPSAMAAEAIASLNGALVLAVRPERQRAAATLDVAWWCREVRALVDAGMTVVEALETLPAQTPGAGAAELQADLLQRLRAGEALSDAMQASGGFPVMLVAAVKAGERTSALVPALDEYLRYHQMLEGLRRKAVSAAIYPALVLSLGLLIAVFLLVYVVPRFSRMYVDLAGPVSSATRVLMWTSQALSQNAWGLAGTVLAVGGLLLWVTRSGRMVWALDWLVERAGPLRHMVDQFRLARLYQSLAMMYRGGYALDDALRHCEALGLGARLAAGVRLAGEALRRGQGVSTALSQANLTDAVTTRLLAVGERTGNFDRILQTVAERHAGAFEVLMERLSRVVEPVLLLTVALLVGGLVIMMYMPVFDIASSVR